MPPMCSEAQPGLHRAVLRLRSFEGLLGWCLFDDYPRTLFWGVELDVDDHSALLRHRLRSSLAGRYGPVQRRFHPLPELLQTKVIWSLLQPFLRLFKAAEAEGG